MAKLIVTDSYFNNFETLVSELAGKTQGLDGCNLVFCEEKVSLMAERFICNAFNGSFNTEVYSFGNFLRVNKPSFNLLSKEGSSMVVKKILSNAPLSCFRAGKHLLAPTLFELITQLKSAKITPQDLQGALNEVKGTLKNKLTDIVTVYSLYEQFIKENGYDDQNSALSYLPEIINELPKIKNANVYIMGYTGFTAQTRSIIGALLKNARSVTAILTGGENRFAYLNETVQQFREMVSDAGQTLTEVNANGLTLKEARLIAQKTFNPTSLAEVKTPTDRIFYSPVANIYAETEQVASLIKEKVLSGTARYRDFSVILPDVNKYKEEIKRAFSTLDIPYFIDEKKTPENHPLISLISSYVEIFRRGADKETLATFYKNPIICPDKKLADEFETYLLKHNISYGRINDAIPVDNPADETLVKIENLRKKVSDLIANFNVRELLKKSNAKVVLEGFSATLLDLNEEEQAAVNDQVYDAVEGILNEMDKLIGDVKIDYNEFKNIFFSGISALELSILPQYNDAVFVGDFKQVSLAQEKFVFAMGLTSAVPGVKEDVALLDDNDINALSVIKIKVEPKIKIVNQREKESVVMALSAFTDKLYLTYPIADIHGEPTVKSEVIGYLESIFDLKPMPESKEYLTQKQALKTFARTCGDFVEGNTANMKKATAFYSTIDKDLAQKIITYGKKEVKVMLDSGANVLMGDVSSPSTIENYHKCPYKMFAERGLGLNERNTGMVDSASMGTISHEIFKGYAAKVSEVNDKQSSDALFEKVSQEVLSRDDFAPFLKDCAGNASLKYLLKECKAYCYKIYTGVQNSPFNIEKGNQEVRFGDYEGCKYPAIPLLDGKVKLKGTIDRLDVCGDYVNVLDYKTGKYDCSEKGLFSGKSLQLYLYGAAVKDKKIAGLYYCGVSEEFKDPDKKTAKTYDGKTLNATLVDGAIVVDKDNPAETVNVYGEEIKKTLSETAINAYVDYALKVSEMAVERISQGVIVPYPLEKECEFCKFKSMCGNAGEERKIGSVSTGTILDAVTLKEKNEEN